MDKKTLARYRDLIRETEQLDRLIEKMRGHAERAEPFIGATGKPHKVIGGTDDPLDPMGAEIADIYAVAGEYLAQLFEAGKMIEDIEKAIEQLPDKERTLMRYRYIEGWRWEDIAREMNYEERQVYRLHGIALQRLREKAEHI